MWAYTWFRWSKSANRISIFNFCPISCAKLKIIIVVILFFFFYVVAEAYIRENGCDRTDEAGANETDLVFLKGLLESPAVTQLIRVSIKYSRVNYFSTINASQTSSVKLNAAENKIKEIFHSSRWSWISKTVNSLRCTLNYTLIWA